jgi:hypothetical protein
MGPIAFARMPVPLALETRAAFSSSSNATIMIASALLATSSSGA